MDIEQLPTINAHCEQLRSLDIRTRNKPRISSKLSTFENLRQRALEYDLVDVNQQRRPSKPFFAHLVNLSIHYLEDRAMHYLFTLLRDSPILVLNAKPDSRFSLYLQHLLPRLPSLGFSFSNPAANMYFQQDTNTSDSEVSFRYLCRHGIVIKPRYYNVDVYTKSHLYFRDEANFNG
jgi:hypothetical protein